MSKNLLLRFYNINKGAYGEPFAICNEGYHLEKQRWSSRGLVVEQIGKTDWECNNHKDHPTPKPNATLSNLEGRDGDSK